MAMDTVGGRGILGVIEAVEDIRQLAREESVRNLSGKEERSR